MAKLTRRGFIGQTTAGAATMGVLAAVPGLEALPQRAPAAATERSTRSLSGPLVAHVRNLATGEVSIMTGTREVIFRDTDLVMRLLKALRTGPARY